ncbi:MAG TPA: Sua5/YciO/YrdC/YwlC family protein [Thermoanaerobaculia bacterium]|jgi:hydrogenase maturation protein HypF|nr:Sua5/YciO/YrdC/YwlC family protein [Thermoanaerobaculia bacterium]
MKVESILRACPDCLAEVLSPFERRYRYPFASCSVCGPALAPRPAKEMCAACRREFEDPNDRHYAAPATACHGCGPRARLVRNDGAEISFDQFSILDDVDAVATLIQRGEIVAVPAPTGFQLLGDAMRESVVESLSDWQAARGEPLHWWVRDLETLRRFAEVSPEEAEQLERPEMPIVLLEGKAGPIRVRLAATALLRLIFRRLSQPVAVANAAGSSPGLLPAYILSVRSPS